MIQIEKQVTRLTEGAKKTYFTVNLAMSILSLRSQIIYRFIST